MLSTTIKVAKSTQEAIPDLGKNAKTLYYMVIGEGEDKIIMNIGEKTYNSIINNKQYKKQK